MFYTPIHENIVLLTGFDATTHRGVDMRGNTANKSVPVYSVGDGVVAYIDASKIGLQGKAGSGHGVVVGVRLDEKINNKYVYAEFQHMGKNDVKVKVGDVVTKSTKIGSTNSFGASAKLLFYRLFVSDSKLVNKRTATKSAQLNPKKYTMMYKKGQKQAQKLGVNKGAKPYKFVEFKGE